MSLVIEKKSQGPACVLEVQGEVDLYSSPDMRGAVIEAIEGGGPVGVDLSGVTYMDSSGVATLVEGMRLASDKSQLFVLVRPSQAVMKVLELSRLDTIFDIRDSFEGG